VRAATHFDLENQHLEARVGATNASILRYLVYRRGSVKVAGSLLDPC